MLKRGGSRFMTVSDQARTVLVISLPTIVTTHYILAERGTRHCGGKGCSDCAGGDEPIDRAYVWAQLGDGSQRLLEFRARQESQLEKQGIELEQVDGCDISVRRISQAFNSPVDVQLVTRGVGRGLPGPDPKLLAKPAAPLVVPEKQAAKQVRIDPRDTLAGSEPDRSKRK